MNALPRRPWFLLIAALALLTLWRLWARQHADVELFFDEAYYWAWSRDLDWGYYSKPPMVAWLIRLGTTLFGNTEFGVRSPAALLYPATSVVLFMLGRRLFAESPKRDAVALTGALTFATLPMIGFATWFVTTDAPLLFFWSLALLFYVRALDSDAWRDWLLLGGALGLGMMSKYSLVFFAPCMLAHLALTGRLIRQLRNPRLYAAAGLALAIVVPNLLWNAAHQFASFKHTAEISQVDRATFKFGNMLAFVAAQFGLFGPILLGGLVLAVMRRRPVWRDNALTLLACFTFTPLILFTGLAFTSRAFANWAAFSYVAAAPLIAALWIHAGRRRLLAAGIALNLLIGAFLFHYHDFANLAGIQLSRKTDPYHRVKGWRALGEAVAVELAAYPDARLAGENRDMLAELGFYAGRTVSSALHPLIHNPSGRISNHYALTADIRDHPQGEFLFVSDTDHPDLAPAVFREATRITTVRVPLYPGYDRVAYLWLARDYQGAHR